MYPYGPVHEHLVAERQNAFRQEAAEARLRRQVVPARAPHPCARLITHLGRRLRPHQTPPPPAHPQRTVA